MLELFMGNLIDTFSNILASWSNIIPLPLFTFLGALIEEIIAPIPSPLVMTLAGSLASAASQNWFYILLLAFTGSIGKTIGAYVIYFIAAKAEHLILGNFGKFIGISETDIEKISTKLNQGQRDDIVLFILRAIPIIPTAPVSVVCGLIKTNLKTYIIGTFLGTFVRNLIYLYLGYSSLNALDSINSEIDTFEKVGYAIILIIITLIFYLIYKQKKKS
jgi:membrane protein DedA with SNARE-associated domain